MKKIFKWRPSRSPQDTPQSAGPTASGSSAPYPSPEPFPSGIKLLHNPSEAALVDIVFVHGLTGHREKTWTAPDATESWPKTLIPTKIPNARVLTFGYDASVADWRSMVSESRVGNHAQNLLNALANFREDDDTNERPIIFVCHSLGGLVCEDALVSSRQRPERHLKAILAATKGVIFLGTPHHGSGLAIWAERFSMSIGVLKQTNTDILRVLRSDSEVLARIQDSFHTMIQSRIRENQQAMEITCFYEELALPGVGLVVPQDSAILPGYIPIGIRNDHQGMTKFISVDDPGFVAVCAELRRWIRETEQSGIVSNKPSESRGESPDQHMVLQSVPQKPMGYFMVPLAPNPDFIGRSDILEMLEETFAHKNNAPKRRGSSQLSLYGLGGVGKTQIALAYVYWLREARPDISVFWAHAGSKEKLQQAFSNIAEECSIPGRKDESTDILALVKDWLQSRSSPWLLVLDNADDLDVFFPIRRKWSSFRSEFIPENNHGAVLITTRNKKIANRLTYNRRPIQIEPMPSNESVEMIRMMSGDNNVSFKQASRLADLLGHLPLALAQAAAFMFENTMNVDRYTSIIEKGDDAVVELLGQPNDSSPDIDIDIPHAVMLTWITSFEQIQEQNPLACELLATIAFFDSHDIPRELLLMNLISRGRINCHEFWRPPISDSTYDEYEFKPRKEKPSYRIVHVDSDGNLRIKLVPDSPPPNPKRLRQPKSTEKETTDADIDETENHSVLSSSRAFSGIILADPIRGYQSQLDLPKEIQDIRPLWSPLRTPLNPDASVIDFEKALGTLKAFCMIREGNNASIEIHRLIQLATKRWLAKTNRYNGFERIALRTLVEAFPGADPEDMAICRRLLPHAHIVLKRLRLFHVALIQTLRALLSEAMGRFYINTGQTKAAREFLQEAFAFAARCLGGSHRLSLQIMRLLAICYTDEGRTQDASNLLSTLVSIEEKVHSTSDPQMIKAMSALAGHHHMEERYEEAEVLLVKAIAHCDMLRHAETMKMDLRVQLMGVLISLGKLPEASTLSDRLLQALTQSPLSGVGRLIYLKTRLAQAMILERESHLTQAEKLCRDSLDGLDLKTDDSQLHMLAIMDVLGSVLYQQHRFDEAGDIQSMVVGVISKTNRTRHPQSLSAIESLAMTRRAQGRLKEAQDLATKAHDIRATVSHSDRKLTVEVAKSTTRFLAQSRMKRC